MLPSRLVQVSGSSRADLQARLILSDGVDEHTEYCTLSHCWGSSPMFKLQRSNFNTFMSNILIAALSKTFQDAMYAVIQLGLSFIWIDSLCIIQDDREDWLREANLMGSVYANSCLNLAATAAADGRGGLILPATHSVKANYIGLPARHGGRYVIGSRGVWDRSIQEGPLAKRGWVVQERFFPPCTLNFAANQLFWGCRRRSCCETFPFPDSKQNLRNVFYGRRLKDNASGAWMTWRSILQHYSRALLTKEEDKLFVMAGIAAYFHSLWGDKYLAGLWQKGVERQLLWSSAHSLNFMQLSSTSIHRRPSRYRAPSWSWASLDGPIVGCRWMGNDFHEVAIRVLAANIKLLSEDQPFGGVQYGSLTIKCGQLKRTLIKSDQIWLQTEPEPKRLSCTIDVISAKPL